MSIWASQTNSKFGDEHRRGDPHNTGGGTNPGAGSDSFVNQKNERLNPDSTGKNFELTNTPLDIMDVAVDINGMGCYYGLTGDNDYIIVGRTIKFNYVPDGVVTAKYNY